jgi:xanthine dehydrogenase small subunit
MRDTIRFLLGHELRELRGVDPAMTVLTYLRRVERRCGTKEGCAEGDCGACTVVLVGPDGGDRLVYRPVNSCIQFLPMLDGRQLLTVEDLKGPDGYLHPVQQAMVEAHGSQCGFCTPGFVMSLFALFHGDRPRDRRGIDDALAGNLCRCTGYGPIIEAARRMSDGAEADRPLDRFDARQGETAAALRALRDGEGIAVEGGGRRYFAPARLDDLADLLLRYPDACILAGGTDVGLWVTKRHRALDPVIHVGRVEELRRIAVTDGHIEIGAAATYAELHALLAAKFPDFGELIRRLGSVQIRNAGTMGGNIANGSPIGDSPPALIALGARLVLRRGDARREIALEDFFIDYGKQDRQPGEFVERIRLPLPDPARLFRCYKISKRFDQDITAVLGAFDLQLRDGRVIDVRIAYGGMAGIPKRARGCEAALRGRPWTPATIEKAQAALDDDFTPLSDLRASREYRRLAARNLLLKLFIETTQPEIATRVVEEGRHAYA